MDSSPNERFSATDQWGSVLLQLFDDDDPLTAIATPEHRGTSFDNVGITAILIGDYAITKSYRYGSA